MESHRHEEAEEHENHIWRDTVDSSPSNRSYKTPSPAGDFGSYEDHSFSWAEADGPSALAQPNRSFPAEPVVLTKSLDPIGVVFDHEDDGSERQEGLGSFNRRKLTGRTRKISHGVAKRVLLGFRVCGFLLCLVSFSVMAANRDRGWALDSFYRYGEFKYCLGVNVIGFVYLGFQVFDLMHFVATEKHIIQHAFRYYSDFFIDQALAYLLVSASSSAATRVADWQSNWGNDKFLDMARTSVGFSFAAFVAVACNSVISGYILFTNKPI